MAEPFLSEIRLASFSFAPRGWALSNGQLLAIAQNQALFSLLGTTFGGDGITNFALPDFRGRVPIHMGNGHTLGERAGQESHTLTIQEMPLHTHFATAVNSNDQNTNNPTNNLLSNTQPNNVYSNSTNNPVTLNPATIANVGGSQAHNNMQPYGVISFIIALVGIYPSQS